MIDDQARTDELRDLLLEYLIKQGFTISDNQLIPPDPSDKENIRQLYTALRNEKINEVKPWIQSVEKNILPYFANGSEIDVEKIYPRLEIVDTKHKIDIFRYASMLWSVPVSSGYGRRMRFLIFDENNNKIIGIFALGDPVINLQARDKWIGWGIEDKKKRLYHVMDAYVLGSVPPYSQLLCGKLVALLTTSNEVREIFKMKYNQKPSVIKQVIREPHLVLLTTTSALGKSSLYNRINFNERRVFISQEFTEGWGHFQFSDGTFEKIKSYMREMGDPIVEKYKYGGGPNWRFRVVKKCLKYLGLSTDLLRHGIKREVFVIPLAVNAREFLCGKNSNPIYYETPKKALFEYFRERWLLPRASRDNSYRNFDRESIRLSNWLNKEI